MNNNLRLFIAIELSAQIQQNLAALIETLKNGTASEVNWVKPQYIHLTLKFLGDTPTPRIPQLKQRLTTLANEQVGFTLEAKGTGAFPNNRQPRILWAGITMPVELITLQKKIEEQMVPLGFPAEKHSFSPHLTLGRVNEMADSESIHRILQKLQNSSASSFGSVSICKVTLFQSTLTPKGPIYAPLERFPLQEPE